ALVAQVRGVLDEYAAHLPLTVRQVFYRLVGTQGYDKTERAYARLCETVGRARRAGLLPFAAFRDDGGSRHGGDGYASPAAFLRGLRWQAEGFTLDRQHGQPVRLWLLCEAAGMAPMLARAADPFGVPVLPSGGFDSLTAKHDLARELARVTRDGQHAEVLHIGDLDPSGEHLFTSLAEDVGAMCYGLDPDCAPTFTRLAVTRAQAKAMDLPSAPPKPTDRRAFTGETVQAEAIPPDVLSALVRDAIAARQDADTLRAVLAREAEARADLMDRLEGMTP
ncbi:MAG TPA: hypothetical protein PLL33_09945, partial [Paracoccus sp. (in: a-proteobacteria)]|nr:hypothetical protein [Paracoccus sp. (in: a-proteobacteria)]